MDYIGICEIEERERIDIEQVMMDSLQSGVDTNVLQFNNIKCVGANRNIQDESR